MTAGSKNAVKLQAEKEVGKARAKFGERIPVDPTEALLTTLELSAGQLFWPQAALEDHEDKHDFTGQVLMRLWNDERDRVARISEAALRAGVQERAVIRPTHAATGAGPRRAYSVIVRVYLGSRSTPALRSEAQRALDGLRLPPPQ